MFVQVYSGFILSFGGARYLRSAVPPNALGDVRPCLPMSTSARNVNAAMRCSRALMTIR